MFLLGTAESSSRPALYDSALACWWSYADLRREVARRTEILRGPKALAFCFCRNHSVAVAWYLAAVEAGHAVALLDEGLAPEFKERLISLYAPDLIFSAAETAPAGGLYQRDAGDYLWRRREPSPDPLHPGLAVLLSTSGSTGSPKFVRLTKANVLANAESISEVLEIRPEDRAISSLPFHYSFGLSVLNTHLLRGAGMVLTNDGLTSPGFWKVLRELECSSFAGVPYSYQVLHRLGLEKLNVPSLRTMTQAGGKLHNDLIARFHQVMAQRGGRFFVMYGQTEATARISILPAGCLPAKLGSAGCAIPRGRLEVTEGGELIYTGPNVMMGYAESRADLALGDVLGGRLATGDMARLDEEGFVYIEGRMKRDAKLFGLRLNLDEIENMLRVNGPTAVICANDKLQIYCEYGDEQSLARQRLDLAARLKLNHHALAFHRLERLPLNANGKIDYQALAGKP